MHKAKISYQSGFTLIELLVVISIISLISSIALTSFVSARKKARDARRIADMSQLQKALEFFVMNDPNSAYPGTPGNVSTYGEEEAAGPLACGGWDTSGVDYDNDGKAFIEPLVDAGYISKAPRDPMQSVNACNTPYGYRYYRYGPGTCTDRCEGKAFYVLVVNTFEEPGSFKSPGFSCHIPGWSFGPPSDPTYRNWGDEGAWVAGACE